MGAKLVGAALNPQWREILTPLQHHVLLVMAYHALDTEGRNGQPARLYFGGHDYLMIACWPDRPDWDSPRYKTLHRKIYRVLRALLETKAVELVEPGAGRRTAVYKITCDVFGSLPKLR